MNISFNAIQNVILIFPDERPVFLREVNNNMYRCSPYFWAKVISEMPFSIITPSVFGCITYYSVGLIPDFSHFVTFLLTLILAYNASSGYSLIISASFSDKQLAVTLTPVLIIPFMLFAGFFVASSQIPWYMKEFEYLSIFKYAYQALMRNQFSTLCPFDAENPGDFLWPTSGYMYPCCNPSDSCFSEVPPCTACSPFSLLGEWPDLNGSLYALTGIYVLCYMVAWIILVRLSTTYE